VQRVVSPVQLVVQRLGQLMQRVQLVNEQV
jgi:hypothetical protein